MTPDLFELPGRVAETEPSLFQKAMGRIRTARVTQARLKNVRRIQAIERQVQAQERHGDGKGRPIVFVVASQHTDFFGFVAGVGLLSSWALRMAGHRVIYYVCRRGVSQCVLGANRKGVMTNPPCDSCIHLRDVLYPASHTVGLETNGKTASRLRSELRTLSWTELMTFSHAGLELGELCLPSLRWVQRKFHLKPDDFTRSLMVEFLASAAGVVEHFRELLDRLRPPAVVLFNGTHYPESIMRGVALARGVPVITYETGLRDTSGFFSHAVATNYAIAPPQGFVMGARENEELDRYLARRMQGDFTMAGVKFWTKMQGLPRGLVERARRYRRAAAVFTNVTWDTSQAYANVFFQDMFEWLDGTLREAAAHADTLFIVRAHPHEGRRGKPSNEPVTAWLRTRGYLQLPNLVLIPSDIPVSSYDLIKLADFCVVYNSTIGLEASMLGKYVLAAGQTRYRGSRVCYDVASSEDYRTKLRELLDAPRPIVVPPEWAANARRYYYFSLFRASLDFSAFLRPVAHPEFAMTSEWDAGALQVDRSPEMRIVLDGIVHGREFYHP